MRKKKVKERIFVKDMYDGQEYCISGDKHFFLIDVTDDYSKKRNRKVYSPTKETI